MVEVFRRAGADPNEVLQLSEAALKRLPRASGGVAYVSPRLMDLLARAEREATRDKSETVGVEHLLHALAQEIKGPAGEILSSFGVGPGAFRPHVGALAEAAREPAAAAAIAGAGGGGRHRPLRSRSGRRRARRALRSGDRPRRRGPPPAPDPGAPLQEPPAHRRRARRRQDGADPEPGRSHRSRRRPLQPRAVPPARARHRRPGRGGQAPRRDRAAPQGARRQAARRRSTPRASSWSRTSTPSSGRACRARAWASC